MKKKSYLMFAGIIAFLLCWSSAMMAQNNSQRESSLRDALSVRQGGMAMGSTLKMPVAQRPSTDNILLQTVAAPLQKPLAAPLLKTNGGIVLWGNVIHQEGWKVGEAAYGMYSVGTTVPIEVKPLGLMHYMEVNSGSGIVGDVFHAMYLDLLSYSEGRVKVHHYTYDIDTWEQLSDDNLGEDGLSLCAMETAQDRKTGKIYGVFWDESGTNLQWGVIDYTKMKRDFIGWAEHQYVALGISKEGTLYGISLDGDLYAISTTDGKETLIGATGVTVKDEYGKYFQQSGEIDQNTNTFYWASIDKDGKSVLYNVDLTTGKANKIGDMPIESQVLALTIPISTASAEAPARVENLKFVFEKGNTTGRIQFTAPSKKINGEPLIGNLTYYVVANNDTVKKAVATAGAKVDDEITVPGGDTKFLVTIANAAGSSPKVRYTAWVGYDIPADIERVKFSYDGTKAVVTWHPVTQGKHGGYVGEVIYDVKRMPDGVQVATNVTGNSLSVPFTTTTLNKYSFVVTPKAGNREGNGVASNGIVIGKAIVPPFKESFYDEESFNRFTAIDANDDGQTWEWGLADDWKGRAQSGYNPKGVADDWLLSPPFELKADRLYTVSLEAYNTLAEQFKEVFQLACGEGYNLENYAKVGQPVLVPKAQTISFYVHNMTVNNVAYIENYDVLYSSAGNDITDFTNIVLKNRQAVSGEWEKVSINVPAGTTYFAIHQKTPQTGLMFGIDDVTYTKETPTPIYYGIYKAGTLINKVPVTVRHCVDVNAGANTQYAVTAIYADGTESAPVEVNVPTGIENIITDGKPVDVYTVDGKLVRRHTTTLRGLRKGVYVVGNKKILIE